MRNLIFTATILGAMTATTGAFAQDSPPASGTASGNVGVSLPGAAPATATAGGTDHDQMAGRLAVGYFGITEAGAGAVFPGAPPAFGSSPYAFTGAAPVVGVRYWLDSMIGIDVGVGLGIIGGSAEQNTGVPGAPRLESDRDSFTAFTLHAGVPLSLASSQHLSWQVVPEFNLGFASVGQDPNGPADGDVSHTGFHLDIGARAGAEIHFGFMGLPQLSLQGTVGLGFAYDSANTTDSQPVAPNGDIETSQSRTALQTSAGTNPWAIFTNGIAAFYYF